MQSEILSSLASVLGRTEREFISVFIESHGRRSSINCVAHFPEQMRKHSQNHGKDKGVHEGMAELLRNSRHEEKHRRPKWMAVSTDTDVYLETVETAED